MKIMTLLGVFVLMSAVFIIAPIEAQSDEAQALYEQAQVLFWKRDRQGALDIANQLVTENPDWAEIIAFRANLLFSQQDSDESEADIAIALALDPNLPLAQIVQARIFVRHRQVDDGLALAQAVAQRAPDNVYVLLYLANIYHIQENYPAAIDTYTQLLTLSTGIAEADPYFYAAIHHLRGMDYVNRDDFASAEQDYARAVEFAPENGAYVESYAWILSYNEKYAEALQYAMMSTELNPDRGYSYFLLGTAFLNIDTPNYADALTALNRAVQLGHTSPTVYSRRGLANDRVGNDEQALLDYALARHLNSSLIRGQVVMDGGIILADEYALRMDDMPRISDFSGADWEFTADINPDFTEPDGLYVPYVTCGAGLPATLYTDANYTISTRLYGEDVVGSVYNGIFYFAGEAIAQEALVAWSESATACETFKTPTLLSDNFGDDQFVYQGTDATHDYYDATVRVGNVIYVLRVSLPIAIGDVRQKTYSFMLELAYMLTDRIRQAPAFGGID
ncbi:MAG: tetratricopeptide repeat protein [bacterium]|nr:tetratricopeptide repeat protein [bacterium]